MNAAYTTATLAVPCRFCAAPVDRECFSTRGVGPAILDSVRPGPHTSRVKDGAAQAADHPARGVDPDVLFAFVDRDGDRLEVRTGHEGGGSICTYSRENNEWTGAHLPASRRGIQELLGAIVKATGATLRIDPDTDAIVLVLP